MFLELYPGGDNLHAGSGGQYGFDVGSRITGEEGVVGGHDVRSQGDGGGCDARRGFRHGLHRLHRIRSLPRFGEGDPPAPEFPLGLHLRRASRHEVLDAQGRHDHGYHAPRSYHPFPRAAASGRAHPHHDPLVLLVASSHDQHPGLHHLQALVAHQEIDDVGIAVRGVVQRELPRGGPRPDRAIALSGIVVLVPVADPINSQGEGRRPRSLVVVGRTAVAAPPAPERLVALVVADVAGPPQAYPPVVLDGGERRRRSPPARIVRVPPRRGAMGRPLVEQLAAERELARPVIPAFVGGRV
mmetsp:Transcript_19038/g.45720  ORF Transcript_19038/g.45720 Transcript_19038/m.45720 type:complete len:299 (+) Transcript_19038:827-1723(+)